MRRTRPLVMPHRRLPHLRDHSHRRRRRIRPRTRRTPRRGERAHLLLTTTRRPSARSVIGFNGGWHVRREGRVNEEVSVMTTAVIGTGGIGSVIARQLASGGETLRLSSADRKSARTLAAGIGRGAVAAADNRDALRGADAAVLALRFTVLKSVIDEIAESLTDKVVVVPSNPLSTDAQGKVSRLLPAG